MSKPIIRIKRTKHITVVTYKSPAKMCADFTILANEEVDNFGLPEALREEWRKWNGMAHGQASARSVMRIFNALHGLQHGSEW